MAIALEKSRSLASNSPISPVTTPTRLRGVLGPRNLRDNYELTVSRRGRFSASLTGLQADAALQLRTRNGRIVDQSNRPGRRSELIQRILKPGTYFIQVVRRTGRTSYTLAMTHAPRPAPPAVDPTPTPNPLQNLWGVYRGISVTTSGLFDPVTRQPTNDPSSFQNNVTVRVNAPLTSGNVAETNPFNLSISSSAIDLSRATLGAIAVYSALPDTQNILRQAWNFQYADNQISGTLTSGLSTSTPSAPNYFFTDTYIGNVRSFFSSPMNIGTTMQGTLTPSEFRLRLQGTSGNTRIFTIEIVAQKDPAAD